jgi:mannose-6-phosphate isomerase-like protein (cupin superfamily)
MTHLKSTTVLAALMGIALCAQGSGPSAAYPAGPPAPASIHRSWADIDGELSKLNPKSLTGAAVSVSPLSPGNVGVRRRSAGSSQYALIHPRSMEVYQIVDGTATFVSGGTLTPPLIDDGPDNYRSLAITGGTSRRVGKDDVIVTPPGTPHWFSQIDGTITYFEVIFEMRK